MSRARRTKTDKRISQRVDADERSKESGRVHWTPKILFSLLAAVACIAVAFGVKHRHVDGRDENKGVHLGRVGSMDVYGDPKEIVMPGPINLDPRKTVQNVAIVSGVRGESTNTLSIHDLLAMTPGQLDRLPEWDLAAISVLVANGLPGFDAASDGVPSIAKVDELARYVAASTAKDMVIFHKKPQEYENSEAQFRMCALITYLRRDLGIEYDPERAVPPGAVAALDEMKWDMSKDVFWKDSSRLFIHGALKGRATCSSLPMLTVAVGRRLGYPLKLVATKEHLFARWETSNEVFNVECAGDGYISHPDAFYRKWPFPLTEEEIKKRGYLKSMTRADELAALFHARVMCMIYNGHKDDSYAWTAKALELQGMTELREKFLKDVQEQRESEARLDLLNKMIADGRIDLKAISKDVAERQSQQTGAFLPENDSKRAGLDARLLNTVGK